VGRKKNRICPVTAAGGLDNKIRRWLQNPHKILAPYIQKGMAVLDVGCGPGFFSIELAQMVGKAGKVIAVDLQEGMLQKLRDKIKGSELQERITLHKCEKDKLGLSESVDFVLAFYVMHEIPDPKGFFIEIQSILRPNGHVLIVEPPFHASKKEFNETIRTAQEAGFKLVNSPKIFPNKTVFLQNRQ
jgi:ubiquinone/menaquinone biosynthesis C-methylase UbiE